MNIETLRDYCLLKKFVTEDFPFGETTLVFRVKEKIFLLVALDAAPLQFNAKSNPEKAIELREEYDAIKSGYHMNKKHWNTVIIDGSVSSKQLKEWIDWSYDLVAGKKKK